MCIPVQKMPIQGRAGRRGKKHSTAKIRRKSCGNLRYGSCVGVCRIVLESSMSLMLVRKVIRRWPVRGPVGVCALSLLFLVGWVGVLRAEGPTRQPDSPLPASVPSAAAAVSVPSSASSSSSGSAKPAESSGAETDFSFDLLPKAPPKTPEGVAQVQEIERKSRIRRGMLRTHLVFGIATMATMAATLVVGQLNYQDQFVNGDFSGRYETPHLCLPRTLRSHCFLPIPTKRSTGWTR